MAKYSLNKILRINFLDDCALLSNGKIIDLHHEVESKTESGYGVKTTYYHVDEKERKLYRQAHCCEWRGGCEHSWYEPKEFVDDIVLTFTETDAADATFLVRMKKFFPQLEPQNVTPVTKMLMSILFEEPTKKED